MSVKVSVVVPVYNTEEYLSKCLDSLIKQTLKDIEIICVNDGSTDSSLQILNDYKIKDNRIKIINQDNLGPSAARNRGLLECKGEYISFIDSDDWIETKAYEKLYGSSKKNDLDLVFFPIYSYDNVTNRISNDNNSYNLNIFDNEFDGKIFNYKDVKNILFHIAVGPVNKLYRKKFLDNNKLKFVEGLFFEDIVFFYDMFLRAKKCSLLRDVTYFRRYREGSTTQSHDDKYFDLIKIIDLTIEVFKKTGNYNEFFIPLMTFIITHLDWTYSLINEKYKKTYFEMIKKEFENLNIKNKDLESLPPIIKDKYQKFTDNSSIKSSTEPLINSDKTLVVGYAFPPFSDTAAITLAKRVLNMDGVIHLVQNDISEIRGTDESLNKVFGKNISKRFIINAPTTFFNWNSIKIFVNSALKEINKDYSDYYNQIYSLTMFPASHFLAFEYKIDNPETHWIAEFSDPMLFDTEGNERIGVEINNEEYLNRINRYLKELNLPLAKNSVSFLCEYLPFIFADEIIFTNNNQREFMLNKFPYKEIKDLVVNKSKVKPYPILPKNNYHLVESDYSVDKSYINFAYFGVFYGTRNLESLYYAFENLEEHLKKKFRFHIFTHTTNLIHDLTDRLSVADNIIVNPFVNFLEFLNLCTKFDCLIVNDAEVKKQLSINPYLPSKAMDYLGSGTDIWALCEKNSPLDGYEFKYKSDLNDYNSLKKTMIQIMVDKTDTGKINSKKQDYKKNKNKDLLVKELSEQISFLKKRNRDLNIKMFGYDYKISSLTSEISNERNKNKNSEDNNLESLKKSISEVANTKSYRFAYFLNRTRNSFIKGNKEERKIYLKWIYLKLFRRNNPYNKRNNPLFSIVDRISDKK